MQLPLCFPSLPPPTKTPMLQPAHPRRHRTERRLAWRLRLSHGRCCCCVIVVVGARGGAGSMLCQKLSEAALSRSCLVPSYASLGFSSCLKPTHRAYTSVDALSPGVSALASTAGVLPGKRGPQTGFAAHLCGYPGKFGGVVHELARPEQQPPAGTCIQQHQYPFRFLSATHKLALSRELSKSTSHWQRLGFSEDYYA